MSSACTTSGSFSSVDLGASTVVAAPTQLAATGVDSALVSVVVKRGNGAPVAGLSVRLSVDKCDAIQPALPTDGNGRAIGSVSCRVEGTRVIHASVSQGEFSAPLSANTSVTFVAPVDAGEPVAGTALDMQVLARTSQGGVNAAFVGAVVFASTDAQASLPADYDFTAADAGTHVFPAGVVLRTAGTQTVSVLDAASGAVVYQQTYVVIPGPAAAFVVTASPGAVVAGQPLALAVSAVDAYRNVVTDYTGTLHVSSNDAFATLPTDSQLTAADAGVTSVLGLILRRAGPIQVQISDAGNAAMTGIATVPVASSTAASLHVLPGSSTLYAGVPVAVSVQAIDPYGNVATSYGGTLHFSASDTTAILPADVSAEASGANTIAEQEVTLFAQGLQSLLVTDVTNGLSGSAEVTVLAAATPATLQLAGASRVNVGQPYAVTLTAYDAYGHTSSDYTGTVHFTSSDSLATLPSDVTFSTADSGVKVLPADVVFHSVGITQWLTATDVSNPDLYGVLGKIAVTTAGPYFTIAFGTYIGPAAAPQTVTVTAHDAAGAIDTAYTGTVHFATSDPQGDIPADQVFALGDRGVLTLIGGVTYRTAGSQRLTAVDALGSLSGSAVFVVAPSGAARILVSGPHQVTAGGSVSITVSVFDAYGNAVPGYNGTVSLGSDDALAVLPGPYAYTGADSGSHTFTVQLGTAGNRSIVATDLQVPGLVGNLTNITVAPGLAVALKLESTGNSDVTAGQPQTLSVSAHDAYDNVATAYTGQLHFTTSDTRGTVPPDYTFGLVDAGSKTFVDGMILTSLGPQTVSVGDAASAAVLPASDQFTVQPGAMVSLQLALPSFVIAGQAVDAAVTALDAYGNVAAGYSGTVHFASTDAAATLPADYTFGAPDAGTHSFAAAVVLQSLGAHDVAVTDSASATSVAQNVNVAAGGHASSLQVSGLVDATAGTAQTVTLRAQDSNGNIVAGYVGRVHFTSSDAQAVMPADYSFTAGDNGSKTFSGIILSTAGTQSITATDLAAPSTQGTQSGVAISPAAPSRLLVSGIAGGVAGTSQSARVRAVDAYGNTATSYSGTVHLSSSDAQASLPGAYTFTAGDAGAHVLAGVVLKTSGTQSVTATDGVSATITGTQSGIGVTPGGAVALQLSGIGNVVAGNTASVALGAVDAFGNTATGYTGTVQFTSTDAQAGLPAPYAFTASDAGRRTFPASVTLKTAGAQSVTASDVVTSSITGTQSNITVSAAVATHLLLSGLANATAGVAQSVLVTAQDRFNNTAAGYTGRVHFTSTDPQASLAADYTFVAADNGSRSFGVVLQTAGSQAVTATDGAGVTGTQTSIAVTAAAAASLRVSGLTSGVAGTSNTATVSARDTYGNVAAGYTGVVRFSSSDAQAVLPANTTFLSSDAGQRTFTNAFVLETAGTQSVTATDASNGGVTGTQTGITVSPAGATRLVVAGLVGATAGTLQSVSVTAKDAYNNTATGYASRVRFSSSDAQATLPADYTFVASDNGQHAFSGVALATAGTQSLTATDIVTASITGTQSSLAIAAASAAVLRVSGISSGTAGAVSNMSVTAADAYGNTATSYTGTVHFASSDAQATLPGNYVFKGTDLGTHGFASAVTLETSGTQSVTATDTVTSSIAGTQTNIVITPAAVQRFAITAPTSSVAGSPFTLTATTRDAYNNIVSSYTGTVQFSSTDAQATLPANYVFTTTDAGAHTFVGGVTLKTAAAQSVTVSDTIVTAIKGTQAGINVQAAPALRLMASYPATVTAGIAGTLNVTATDAYGNTATGYTGSVAINSSDANATLPAIHTYQPADNGTYAFSVTLTTAGSSSITAIDTSNTVSAGTRSGIAVQPANAKSLVVSGLPASLSAGQSGSATVTAYDLYGNVATNYAGTVSFTSSDALATLPLASSLSAGTKTFSNAVALKTAGNQSVTAGDGTLSGHQNVTVVASTVSNANSALVLSPASLVADHNATTLITVTARDAFGNDVSGQAVTLNANGTGNTMTPTGGTTDANGVFTAQLKSTSRGAQRITATMGSVNLSTTVTFTAAPTCFAAYTSYSTGAGPYDVAIADVDNDGRADIVVPHYYANTVGVLINQGADNFAAPVTYATGPYPQSVGVADLNGDGKVDLAVPNFQNAAIAGIFINQGSGTFASQVTYSVSSYASGGHLADLSGDGKPDFFAASYTSATVCLLINQGAGTFGTAKTYAVGNFPYDVAAADFNADGKLDLVATNNSSDTISILVNQGSGTYGTQTTYSSGGSPRGVAAVDLSGDGKADVVITNNGNDTAGVFLNNGSGTFAAQVTYAVGSEPQGVTVGDFNGDGKNDFAVANTLGATVSVLLNKGAGAFNAQTTYAVDPTAGNIAAADVNGDNKPDLVVTHTHNKTVSILLNTCY